MKKLLKIFLIEDSTTLFSPILSTDCETKTTVRWIDHRGCVGSLNAMENTINSFKNAAGIDSFGELKLTFIQLWIINLFVSMMQLHFAMNMVIKKEKIYSLTCEQAISKNIMHSKNYPRNHEGYFDPIKNQV